MSVSPTTHDQKPWMIPELHNFLHWLEAVITTVSGTAIVAYLIVSGIDLFTNGNLFESIQWMPYAASASFMIGVDGQAASIWFQVRRFQHQSRPGWAFSYTIIGLGIAYNAFIVGLLQMFTSTYHVSIVEALKLLHMDQTQWIVQRIGVAVFLACFYGYERGVPHVELSEADMKARADREKLRIAHKAEIEAEKRKAAGAKMKDWIDQARAFSGKHGDTSEIAIEPVVYEPGTYDGADIIHTLSAPTTSEKVFKEPSKPGRKLTGQNGTINRKTIRQQVEEKLKRTPGLSAKELAKLLTCSERAVQAALKDLRDQ